MVTLTPDAGATASDDEEGDITANIVSGMVTES